jgi:hypothetical protein
MNIPRNQISYRKRIGSAGRHSLYGIGVIGGLHIVANDEGEILGMGSHPLMARHIAKKHASDVTFSDMAKSEAIDPRDFADLLPHWESETDRIRKLASER